MLLAWFIGTLFIFYKHDNLTATKFIIINVEDGLIWTHHNLLTQTKPPPPPDPLTPSLIPPFDLKTYFKFELF